MRLTEYDKSVIWDLFKTILWLSIGITLGYQMGIA